jgi:hypothetical protein
MSEKEAKDIEDFLNRARDKINKEAGSDVMPHKAKVIFVEEKKKVVQDGEEIIGKLQRFIMCNSPVGIAILVKNSNGGLVAYEQVNLLLSRMVVIDKSWLQQIMSSTEPLTDVRWFIKTKLLGEVLIKDVKKE